MEDVKYDVVIVSHEDDFYKIKYTVEYAVKNLKFDELHLILSERAEYTEKDIIEKFHYPVFYHKESDILKIDKSRLKHRPSWIYQMMLKIFQNVTKNDNFLIIESDVVINKPLNFFENGKTIFYVGEDQNHQSYFDFNRKILNIGREYDHSFISEFIMYNKNIVKDLLSKSQCQTVDEFINKLYDIVTPECYPADYELYGNFCYKYYKDSFDIRKLNVSQNRRHLYTHFHTWSEKDIQYLLDLNKNRDVISFHTYKPEK